MRKLPIARLQGALARVARDLGEIEVVLEGLASRIPGSPQRDAMEEGEMPPDLATHLLGVIEHVCETHVRHARKTLEEAAAATPEDLERHWRAHRGRWKQ
jgi:hypothetical protein